MSVRQTRDCIVEAADDLFYRQGYTHTSFADIAGAVQISRGNFYYHFKTKDQILDAVVEARSDRTRAMLDQWQRDGGTPAERIRSFIRILLMNRVKIERYGCPVGTLTTELAKLDHAAQDEANALFMLFRTWLSKEFAALGLTDEADDLAMHLLAMSQGVATLTNAFRDVVFTEREVARMEAWLEEQVARAARQ